MLFGVGIDLVNSDRIRRSISRQGQRFKDRIYTPAERLFCEARHDPALAYARLFALKEAGSKAIGTGMAIGVGWKHFELIREAGYKPRLVLHGRALQRVENLTPPGYVAHWDWSISDDPPFATAIVTIVCVSSDTTTTKLPLCAARDDRT